MTGYGYLAMISIDGLSDMACNIQISMIYLFNLKPHMDVFQCFLFLEFNILCWLLPSKSHKSSISSFSFSIRETRGDASEKKGKRLCLKQ